MFLDTSSSSDCFASRFDDYSDSSVSESVEDELLKLRSDRKQKQIKDALRCNQ